MKPFEVIVNGKCESVAVEKTVAQFLDGAGWKATQVVVEYNGTVLPRQQLAETILKQGDRLEVLVPVAGG